MPRTKSTDDIASHQKIVSSFRRLAATRGPAVKIRTIAEAVKKDPRTVRRHLELMAVHHDVVFLNPEKSVVARLPDLEKVVRAERASAEREELAYASSAAGARLAWARED